MKRHIPLPTPSLSLWPYSHVVGILYLDPPLSRLPLGLFIIASEVITIKLYLVKVQ